MVERFELRAASFAQWKQGASMMKNYGLSGQRTTGSLFPFLEAFFLVALKKSQSRLGENRELTAWSSSDRVTISFSCPQDSCILGHLSSPTR
jgi:hypothetical protein